MDLAERIRQGKRQNEALKSELQRLIELGLKGTSRPGEDPKETEVPAKDEPAKGQDEPPRRTRSYDVEGVRRYMKEREKRRSERSKPEESKAQMELRKKRLEELHKKSLELVTKNVKKRRSVSANRGDSLRPDHFEVSRHKFAPSEQISSSNRVTVRSRSVGRETDRKVPTQNVTKTQTKIVPKKPADLPEFRGSSKNTNEPVKSSTHSTRLQDNILIPQARSEADFVIENLPRSVSKRIRSVPETSSTNVLLKAAADLDNPIVPKKSVDLSEFRGSSKNMNEPVKPSTHSTRSQENIVIPEARSEADCVIENLLRNVSRRTKSVPEAATTNALLKTATGLDNLTLPETRLEPSLRISKSRSLPQTNELLKSSIHSNDFPADSHLVPHLNLMIKPEKRSRNVSKLSSELVKSSIHSIHSDDSIKLPHTHLESDFIISKRDTIPQNISIRTRPIPETITTNELAQPSLHSHSQDKPSVVSPNLHLNVPENLQNITKRIPRDINIEQNLNIPHFSPKICSTNVKTLNVPQIVPENLKNMNMWLHDSHHHPFNFVDTIKRKLDFTNLVDIGTQDSIPALDARNIEHLNLVNNNNKSVEKESDTSDTSKNIPDISTESGRSLRLNAESVRRNLSREFSNDEKSLIESLRSRHTIREESNRDSHRTKSRSKQLFPEVSIKLTTESLQSRQANVSEVFSKNACDNTISPALCSKQYSEKLVKTASREEPSRKRPVKSLRNKPEVFLKFEAEFHLLDAFRESLLNYSALEESLMSLKNQNNVDVSDIIWPSLGVIQAPSLHWDDKLDQISLLSTVDCSRRSVSEGSLVRTERAESLKPTSDLAAFSVQMFEQLIKDEESRLRNIQVNLQIREKVLLDRTKTELACLEMDRKNSKAKGNLHEVSVIRKKQRAILLNHQKEQDEIKVLKQMQKTASEERKTTLRQQEHLIKKQFCMEDVARKMRSRRDSRERRRTGPLKIPDSVSAMSEVSMSRSFTDRKPNADCNEPQLSGSGKDSDTQMVAKAINKRNEYSNRKRDQLKKILLMHEETLEKRRKATEELLKWHRRLAEEEKRVTELESKADTVISRRKTLLLNENDKTHIFTGRELNQMWYTLTDNEEVKFTEDKVYSLSQSALEKFCRNAKEHLMKAGRDKGDLTHLIDEFKEDVHEEQRYQDESFEVDTEASTNRVASEEIVQGDTDEVSTAPATDTENFVKTEVTSKLNKRQISASEATSKSPGHIATTLEDILSRTEADLKQIVAQFEYKENTTEDVSTSLIQSNASRAIKEEMTETSDANVVEEIHQKSEDDVKTVSSVESSVNEGREGRISSIIEDLIKSEVGTLEEEYLGVSLEDKSSKIEHNDNIIETVKEDTNLSVSQAAQEIVEEESKSKDDEPITTIDEDSSRKSSTIPSKFEQSISKDATENIEDNISFPLSQNEKVEVNETDPNELSSSSIDEHEKSQSVPSEERQVTEAITEEDDSSQSQDVKIGDETYLVIPTEEIEKSLEEKSPKISDVKQRVHEIMDAHQSPKERSPRVQDLYVTTYDLVSPTNSPDSGSPVTEKALVVASIFGNEAEELLKKQLAIEQEIKQITEQQRKEKQVSYIYVREIPNKPPPPYTPPGSIPPTATIGSEISVIPSVEEVHDIVPSCARILHKAYLSKTIDTVSISENTMNLILTDVPKERFRFVFDLCKDLARRHYSRFREEPLPSWLKEETGRRGSRPLDPKGLERYLEENLRELFGFEKSKRRENSIIKWSRKKRDHVDEVLVRVCQDEEPKWKSCEKDKKLIMDQMVNQVMKLLIEDSCAVMEKLFVRTEVKVE